MMPAAVLPMGPIIQVLRIIVNFITSGAAVAMKSRGFLPILDS